MLHGSALIIGEHREFDKISRRLDEMSIRKIENTNKRISMHAAYVTS